MTGVMILPHIFGGTTKVDKRTLAHWLWLRWLLRSGRLDGPAYDHARVTKRGPAQGEGLEESWAAGGYRGEIE